MTLGEFLVLCDLSENFKFILQNEAKGFHWNKKQSTHDSVAVYPYILKLIRFLESRFEVIDLCNRRGRGSRPIQELEEFYQFIYA